MPMTTIELIRRCVESTDRVVTIINSLKNAPDASKNGLQEFLDVAEVLRYLANQLSSSSGSGSSSSSTSTTSLPDSISELVDLLNAYAQELTATKSEPPFSSRERTILEAVNGVVAAHAYCLLSEHVLPSAPASSFAHLDFTVQLEHDSVARRLWGEKFGVEATHAPWPALSDLIVSASGAHAPSPAVLALLQEALGISRARAPWLPGLLTDLDDDDDDGDAGVCVCCRSGRVWRRERPQVRGAVAIARLARPRPHVQCT